MYNPYTRAGRKWNGAEGNKILQIYNEANLSIDKICLEHERFLGGIITRLKKLKGCQLLEEEIRGYNEFIISEDYNEMKKWQQSYYDEKYKKKDSEQKAKAHEHLCKTKEDNVEQNKVDRKDKISDKISDKKKNKKNKNDDDILIAIRQNDYNSLKENINELRSELSEIKNMIKNLAIYDFE
mgnify:CR=1 FL=1